MITLRRALIVMSIALLASVLLVACGTDGNMTNTGSANTNMMNTTPTATGGMGMGMDATPTATMGMGMKATPKPTSGAMGGGNKNAFVLTTMVKINGTKVQVLTNNKGHMLYYYKKDSMMASNCTGACAMSWPALLAPKGAMTVTSSVMLPHKLSIHKTANGQQVFYDGHPLYTYTGDMTAGQFTGRGMGNAWYLVGVNL